VTLQTVNYSDKQSALHKTSATFFLFNEPIFPDITFSTLTVLTTHQHVTQPASAVLKGSPVFMAGQNQPDSEVLIGKHC